MTGETKSSNFPTTAGGFDRTFNVDTCPRCGIDQYDAFVSRRQPRHRARRRGQRVRGRSDGIAELPDDGRCIPQDAERQLLPGDVAVDASGNAYVAGSTRSADYPTTAGAFDTTHHGTAFEDLFDVFVTKLNAAGSGLVYSTFLGDAGAAAVVLDGTRLPSVAGGNASTGTVTLSSAAPTAARRCPSRAAIRES